MNGGLKTRLVPLKFCQGAYIVYSVHHLLPSDQEPVRERRKAILCGESPSLLIKVIKNALMHARVQNIRTNQKIYVQNNSHKHVKQIQNTDVLLHGVAIVSSLS